MRKGSREFYKGSDRRAEGEMGKGTENGPQAWWRKETGGECDEARPRVGSRVDLMATKGKERGSSFRFEPGPLIGRHRTLVALVPASQCPQSGSGPGPLVAGHWQHMTSDSKKAGMALGVR